VCLHKDCHCVFFSYQGYHGNRTPSLSAVTRTSEKTGGTGRVGEDGREKTTVRLAQNAGISLTDALTHTAPDPTDAHINNERSFCVSVGREQKGWK